MEALENNIVLDHKKEKSMNGTRHLSVIFMILIIMLAAGVVRVSETNPAYDAPYLSNVFAFSYELAGNQIEQTDVWPEQWFFNQPAPFKYRLLGKLPILATYKILLKTTEATKWPKVYAIYWAYLLWTIIFLYTFLWYGGKIIHHLVEDYFAPHTVTQPRIWAALSTATLALLPPILFAFKFPVHGNPNELLGYTLIAASLLALRSNRLLAFTLFAVLGVFCRETNLIVLAPLMFLTSIRCPRRLGIAIFVAGVWIAYRLLWPGSYNPEGGAALNSQYIWESSLFLFLVFGPFWLLGTAGALTAQTKKNIKTPFAQAILHSFWPTTLAVLAVVWFFARVREIRIEYILFFYFIPTGLWWASQQIKGDWRKTNPFIIVGVVLFSLAVGGWVHIALLPIDELEYQQLAVLLNHFHSGFGGGWRHQLVAYTIVTVPIIGLLIVGLWKKCALRSVK